MSSVEFDEEVRSTSMMLSSRVSKLTLSHFLVEHKMMPTERVARFFLIATSLTLLGLSINSIRNTLNNLNSRTPTQPTSQTVLFHDSQLNYDKNH